MILSIDYTADELGNISRYGGVLLKRAEVGKEKFFTDNVVVDFRDALNKAIKLSNLTGEPILYSSSVDHFIVDSGGRYEWVDSYIVDSGEDPYDSFVDTIRMDDMDDELESGGTMSAIAAFRSLRQRHGVVVEENMMLHNMLSLLCNSSMPPEEIAESYRMHLNNSKKPAYTLAPVTLMALEVIEVICSGYHLTRMNSTQTAEQCFRMAHVALGVCTDKHDDWLEELSVMHANITGSDNDAPEGAEEYQ